MTIIICDKDTDNKEPLLAISTSESLMASKVRALIWEVWESSPYYTLEMLKARLDDEGIAYDDYVEVEYF